VGITIIYKNYISFQNKPHIQPDDSKFLFLENFAMEHLRKEDVCTSRGSQPLKNFQTFVKTVVY
jgi:hypothetical protein